MKYKVKFDKVSTHIAAELCLQNPGLLSDWKSLLVASRKKLDESGYGGNHVRIGLILLTMTAP